MGINPTSAASLSAAQVTNSQFATTAIWSGGKNRLVSIITTGAGLVGIVLIIGLIAGIAMWAKNRHSQDPSKKKTDEEEARRQAEEQRKKDTALSNVAKQPEQSQAEEQRKKEAARNVTRQREQTDRKEGLSGIANRSNSNLSNEDLKRLVTTAEFKNAREIDLSSNPKLTYKGGLELIGKGCQDTLKVLNLSKCNLTNQDLKAMADSGYFNQITTLILGYNPQLTGEGIAWIAQKGFTNLKILDLKGNPKVIPNCIIWLKLNGWKSLEILDLTATNITEGVLQKMIKSSAWFRNLKGLILDNNPNLEKIPDEISQLTNLEQCEVQNSRVSTYGTTHYYGSGLFFRGCKKLKYTEAVETLIKKGKAFGFESNMNVPTAITPFPKFKSPEEIDEFFKPHMEELKKLKKEQSKS